MPGDLDTIRLRLEDLRTDVRRLPSLPAKMIAQESESLLARLELLTMAIQEREVAAWELRTSR